MVYGCGNSFIKFLVFAFNLLICAGGAIIMGVSLWANLDNNFSYHISQFVHDTKLPDDIADLGKYQASLWVLVGVGALLFLVGFLGCCGAACESTVLLTLFFVVVLILAAFELGAAIFAATNKQDFHDKLDQVLEKGWEAMNDTKQFEVIQDAFKCCGLPKHPEGYQCDQHPDYKTNGNCLDKIWHDVETAGSVAIIIAFVVLVIEVFALIFSCILCRAFRERSPGYYA